MQLTAEQLAVLKNAVQTMQHALIFVQTKEKMYSVGVELYEKALADFWVLVEEANADTAQPDGKQFDVVGPDELSRLTCVVGPAQADDVMTVMFRGFRDLDEARLFVETLHNTGVFCPPSRGALQ